MNKHKIQALAWLKLNLYSAAACPFASNFGSSGGSPPNDAVHRQGLRRRLLNSINSSQPKQRELQVGGGCFTEDTYDAIFVDIEAASAAQPNNVARSHFLGGILRLGEMKTAETVLIICMYVLLLITSLRSNTHDTLTLVLSPFLHLHSSRS
eukprot:scaffold386_cov135-Skeletonema_menzelii.AAC.9